jgi:MFS family permease
MPEVHSAGLLARVGRNVLLLGATSLLTDVSSEMVNAVLPLYLMQVLRFSPLGFGVFDGIYQGASALMRLWSGVVADRRRARKGVAALGYGISALTRLGLVVAGGWWMATAAVLWLDRLAKGLRTAPRDALIALSSSAERRGEAFGVHRAMDTAGAVAGPLIAFVLLASAPGAFDAVFAVSLTFAVAGFGVLVLFVENRTGPTTTAAPARLRTAGALLAIPPFRALVAAGTLLSIATISDAFVYLIVQRRADLDPSLFPLLPVAMTVAFVLLAIPAGRLADAIGRAPVFLAGYGALAVAYALLAFADAAPALLVSLPLLGAHYAATDGVLMAMASRMLPPERMTTGLAMLTTGTTAGRLLASAAFGAAWSWRGPQAAVLGFLVWLLAATVGAGLVLRSRA